MIVQCDKCKALYDDAIFWTICPHDPLGGTNKGTYCRKHDLDPCPFCDPTAKNPLVKPDGMVEDEQSPTGYRLPLVIHPEDWQKP